MQNNPLHRVVFIQKVAAFTKKTSFLKDLLQLAYINNSWNDTIKNYSFHLFEQQITDIENFFTLELLCKSVIKWGVIWFVNVIMSSEMLLTRFNFPRLLCKNKVSSLDVARFVFEKIVQVGGKQLLKSQLAETDKWGRTCLLNCCVCSLSTEVVELVLEKIVDVGGTTFLKIQLGASDSDGWNCLMRCSSNSKSPEVLKLLCDKTVEAGGMDLLKCQLCATSTFGWNCLVLATTNSSSSEVLKLLAAVLIEVGVFKYLYTQMDDGDKQKLRKKAGIEDDSWVPDADSVAEVKKMLKR